MAICVQSRVKFVTTVIELFGMMWMEPSPSRRTVRRRLITSTTPVRSAILTVSPISNWFSTKTKKPVTTSFTRVCAPKPIAKPDDARARQQRLDVHIDGVEDRHHGEEQDHEHAKTVNNPGKGSDLLRPHATGQGTGTAVMRESSGDELEKAGQDEGDHDDHQDLGKIVTHEVEERHRTTGREALVTCQGRFDRGCEIEQSREHFRRIITSLGGRRVRRRQCI